MGVGFWGAGRDGSHTTSSSTRRDRQYQIVTPSTPHGLAERPRGIRPYEEAVLETPILEEFDKPEDYKEDRRPARDPQLRPCRARRTSTRETGLFPRRSTRARAGTTGSNGIPAPIERFRRLSRPGAGPTAPEGPAGSSLAASAIAFCRTSPSGRF